MNSRVPRLLAHRGGAMEFDENSLAAFQHCHDIGVRGFETDVRMTCDGVLVLSHDDTLERCTTGTGPVESLGWPEVAALRLKSSGAPVPRLEELLGILRGQSDVFIELEMKTASVTLFPDACLSLIVGGALTAA